MELTQQLQMMLEVKLVYWRHCTSNITPIHLEIESRVNHNHDSRALFDTLHGYGSCVSYDELKPFLTSAAENELYYVQNGIYIPSSMNITTVDCSLVQ